LVFGVGVSTGASKNSSKSRPDDIPIGSVDRTRSWKYPYKVSAERQQQILTGVDRLTSGVHSVKEAIEVLGSPDTVSDLNGPFYGLRSTRGWLLNVTPVCPVVEEGVVFGKRMANRPI